MPAMLMLQVMFVLSAFASDVPTRKVSPSDLPMVPMEGDLENLKTALKRQVAQCESQNGEHKYVFGNRRVTRREWCISTGTAFLKLADSSQDVASLYAKARTEFEWYRSIGGNGQGEVLFTGYYFPSLAGSLAQSAPFNVPFYMKPADLVQVVEGGKKVWRRKNVDGSFSTYHDRRTIDEGKALAGKGLELAWVSDAYDAAIFQVQGAGAVMLPDGRRMILNYAAQNGHPYVSMRRILKEKGVAEEYLSMPGMKRYFKEHPEELKPTLMKNPSYVFFKVDDDGPYGTEVVLSPGHSIAVDNKIYPMGAMALYKTTRPISSGEGVGAWKEFSRFAVTQDVGGAIQGPGRIDIYWGEGDYAEFAAGHMNQPGELYFAVVR
jgi:membrane-bound lytic murein transglycosylase A